MRSVSREDLEAAWRSQLIAYISNCPKEMDSIPNDHWRRLVRYLSREATPEEQDETQTWILEDEQRAKLMDELREVWEATDRSPQSRDLEGAWESMVSKVESDGQPAGGISQHSSVDSADASSSRPENTSSRSPTRRRLRERGGLLARALVFAGVVVGLVALTVLFANGGSFLSSEREARTFSTRPGERATVRLSDGSEVRLNVDSRLTMPSDFDGDKREVHLEGEAFFDVAQDSTRPFVIQMDGASVRVLGTAFGVKAYPEDRRKEVAVKEGTVAFQPSRVNQSKGASPVLLRAQHLGVVAGQHVKTVQGGGEEVKQHLAWTEGQLIFDDAPFDEVHRKLERWYDLEIEVRFETTEVDRLNATFEEESSMNAVAAVASALGLRYRTEGETVVFYREKQGSGGASDPVRRQSS